MKLKNSGQAVSGKNGKERYNMKPEELINWASEKNCLKAIESLKKNEFIAFYCQTKKEASIS